MTDKRDIIGEGEYGVAAEYLIALQEFAAERGVSPQQMLKDSGLSLSALVQPQAKIGHLAMEKVLRNMLTALPDPWIGIEYGHRMTIAKHGMLGFAAQLSQTLMDAAQLVVQFIKTRTEFEELEFFIKDNKGCLRILQDEDEADPEIARFHALATFTTLDTIARRLTGKMEESVQTEMLFSYPAPGEVPEHMLPPGLSLHFNQLVNELRFPLEMMTEPLPKANPELEEAARAEMEEEMLRLNINADVAAMVRMQIRDVEGRLPTVEQVADALHMSPRTLKRKLHDSGTSYQQIKDSERFRKAIHMLEVTDHSLEKVAHTLGYSDASNFTKAFKNWAEMSPSEYRSRLKHPV